MKIITFRVRWYASWIAAGLLALLILLIVLHRSVERVSSAPSEEDVFAETACQTGDFDL